MAWCFYLVPVSIYRASLVTPRTKVLIQRTLSDNIHTKMIICHSHLLQNRNVNHKSQHNDIRTDRMYFERYKLWTLAGGLYNYNQKTNVFIIKNNDQVKETCMQTVQRGQLNMPKAYINIIRDVPIAIPVCLRYGLKCSTGYWRVSIIMCRSDPVTSLFITQKKNITNRCSVVLH